MSEPFALAAASQRLRGRPGRPRKSPAVEVQASANASRLLDLEATAAYLGLSSWTIRDLEAAGTLKRVRVPLSNGASVRKLLFDIEDLAELVVRWKEGGPA